MSPLTGKVVLTTIPVAVREHGAEAGEPESRGRPGFTASEFANIVLGNARENNRHTDTLAMLSTVMLLASVLQLVLVQRLIKAAASASPAPRPT